MALRDIEAFVRERAAIFDPNLDLTSGSPFDKQVIQPLARRLGTDPFTVDLETFITTRLQQAFPEVAASEGDGLTDLFVKPAQVLWDPIIREISRIGKGLSFKDPDTLTEEEAEALGANLFAERPKGAYARGVGRIYFAQAQNVSITPVNFFTAKSGLVFVPTESQSIRVDEMLLNDSGDGTFYFDVNSVAESPGSEYNLAPGELSSIANLDAAVRVTNLRRFKDGEDPATAAEFVDQARQSLTEKSMTTLRGIAATLTAAFPEITRLNSTGFGDTEMQRDVLRGGGLGAVRAAGVAGRTTADSIAGTGTNRFTTADVGADFTQSVGPVGAVNGSMVLTVIGAFPGATTAADMPITRVVSADTVEVADGIMLPGKTGLGWTVRKKELTLSGIPGGILFPNNPDGTLTVPDNEVHIGGSVDLHVRGSSTDESTLVLNAVTDDEPELAGAALEFDMADTTLGVLLGLVLGNDYLYNDPTYQLLARAAADSLSLQVLDGPNAGVYRLIQVTQVAGFAPAIKVAPAFPTLGVAPDARWKIFDAVNVSLFDIKETKVSGGDLISAQNSNIVKTGSGTDFDAFGVAKGDVLRIITGQDAGDYTITADPLVPSFLQLQIDTKLTTSLSGVQYAVFRPNAAGNLQLPLVRIKSVELLDSSNQPLGTKVPYARAVDVQSRSFQNPARGIKHTLSNVQLGLLSTPRSTFEPGLASTLHLQAGDPEVGVVDVIIGFPGGAMTPAALVDVMNAVILLLTGESDVAVAIPVQGSPGLFYIGVRPFGPTGFVQSLPSGTASNYFFSTNELRTTNDIRYLKPTGSFYTHAEWLALDPTVYFDSQLDVIQVITGNQLGVVEGPYTLDYEVIGEAPPTDNDAVRPSRLDHPFFPEAHVSIQIGARSIGSVRVYYLEPTSVEVRARQTVFTFPSSVGPLRFLPDPTLSHQQIPALPDGGKPHDGDTTTDAGMNILVSPSRDFVSSGVRAGDQVIVDFQPLAGTIALGTTAPGLVHKTFTFSLDGSAFKTLVFIRDDLSLPPTDVSQLGVVSQINAAAGITLAKLRSDNHLEFDVEVALTVAATSTCLALILGNVDDNFGGDTGLPFTSFDQTNEADSAGINPYVIDAVLSPTSLRIVGTFAIPAQRQQFKVLRVGVQRVSTAEMTDNVAEAGLYYADFELVSEGAGDIYNLESGQQLTVEGERADGYYLTTDDSNLSFSPVERPRMVFSRSLLEAGVDDDPVNATQLVGQNLQVTYERSSLVDSVNSFALAETERIINSSPLGRHLVPHFVRFDAEYAGGSSEEVTVPALEAYINSISPVDAVESSDVQGVLKDKGATSITNPISLIALVHRVDRSIWATRSQNRLTTGNLSAFIPDRLNVVRRVT